jgi:tRNA pseudouridine55 synthase
VLREKLEGLRGEIELPIPAASAVKVGGERAYRLARRGIALEMPLRRSRIDRLDVIAYTGDSVTLDLRVSSGTYVRALADAIGGHCRTLRRLEVGPFRVEDADPERMLPPAEALPFLPAREVDASTAEAIRQGRERVGDDVRVLHDGELVAVDGTVLP